MNADSLSSISASQIHVQICNKDGKQFNDHTFEVKTLGDKNLDIPDDLEGQKFKTAKLVFTVKKSGFFGSKDCWHGDLSMRSLDSVSEFTKTVKFDYDGKKCGFDVRIMVREAFSGKEMT